MNVITGLEFAPAFAIGIVCRAMGIPLPAPSKLTGALLVVVMTLGFLVTNAVLVGS